MELNPKRILVIGINYSPELTGIGKYTGEMGAWLSEHGHDCTVVTSYPYYPYWKIQKPYTGWLYKKEQINSRHTIYRCPFYVPKTPSGIKRIIHEASFFYFAFLLMTTLLFKKKYDHIFCIAPPFHLGFLALYYRFFRGGNINYHIQDLQIEAARDLKVIKSGFVFDVLFGLEKYIIKRVNSISTISSGMLKKVGAKTDKEVLFFPNWVDTIKFYPLKDKAMLKRQYGFADGDRIILYSGSIGEKQGLDSLVEIAVKTMPYGDIKFIICGTGPYKQKLEKMAKDNGAVNLFFLPLQSHESFNAFLNFADIHLVLQKKEASDLVMPSKLTTILAAGGLVIATAVEGSSLYDDIMAHKMGIVIPPEDNDKLYAAIIDACLRDYSSERVNARLYAEKYLNKDSILDNMNQKLLG